MLERWTAFELFSGGAPAGINARLLNHIDSSEPCRGIYVMGHSHEPMLKRVELWPSPPRKYR